MDYLLDWGRQQVSCSSHRRHNSIIAAAALPCRDVGSTDVIHTAQQ